MKKLFCMLLCLALLAGVPACAAADDLILITEETYAPLYASYDYGDNRVIAHIPEGSVALHIATIDWGYCVAFGNHVGYIPEESGIFVDDDYYYFSLPDGSDYCGEAIDPPCGPEGGYVSGGDWNVNPLVPEFPYYPIYAEANQKLATRSGPNTKYTEPGGFRKDIVDVYYQTSGNGVQWGCIEFEEDGLMYRLYTGMKRIDTYVDVPQDEESYVWAYISGTHIPHHGPGYHYASTGVTVPAETPVRAYYQQYGWLMFEYDLPDGDVLRAWAPAGTWY